MAGADQQLIKVAASLEQHLCQALGLTPLPQVIRNQNIKNLRAGIVSNRVVSEAEVNQALQYFSLKAADKDELDTRLKRLHSKNIKGYKEFLTLLHLIAAEPSLKVLSGVSLAQTENAPALPGATAPASSAPATATAAGTSSAQPSTHLGNVTNTRPGAVAAPQHALHGMPAPSAAMAGATTPVASYSSHRPDSNGSSLAPSNGNGGNYHLAAMQAQGHSFGQITPAGVVATPRTRDNPVYGQEGVTSPVVRSKEYTPSLATTISARKRATELRAFVPAAGILFAPLSSSSGSSSSNIAPQHLQQHPHTRMPSWNSERPYLTGLDVVKDALTSSRRLDGKLLEHLSSLPSGIQELAAMNDLLYAFMGLDGKYIHACMVTPHTSDAGAVPSGRPTLTFSVEQGLEPCLQEMVEKVLPICEYVVVVQRFVELRSTSHGLVSHALAAALRGLLQDWLLMVTQLEHQLRLGQLTMQALIFYCQGPLASLRLLAAIAAEASSEHLTSAGLLNLLHSKSSSLVGDRHSRALLHKLLHTACVPYFRMLERWLCEGSLEDPYGEFMVQEDKAVTKDDLTPDNQLAYWYCRYTLRKAGSSESTGDAGGAGTAGGAASTSTSAATDNKQQLDVPVFLQSHANVILTTGKYLNAIRECGQSALRPLLPPPEQLQFDPHSSFLQPVSAAHAGASAALLELLVHRQQLLSWLRSIKHYFLMDQGDVMVHLIEATKEELSKPAREISRSRLQSLVELAIRTSSLASDPHSDNLSCDLDPRTLQELVKASGAGRLPSLTAGNNSGIGATPATPGTEARGGRSQRRGEDMPGWELFMLRFQVPWPINLVVSPSQLGQYQLIFKLIFTLKHTERELAVAWHRMGLAAKVVDSAGRARLKAAYSLCQQQLFFLQEYLRYITFDILEPLWHGMEAAIARGANVDEVIQCHRHFLQKALDGLLLPHPRILRGITSLEQMAQTFCNRISTIWQKLEAVLPAPGAAAAAGRTGSRRPSSSGAAAGGAGSRPSSSSGAAGNASRLPSSSGAGSIVNRVSSSGRSALPAMRGAAPAAAPVRELQQLEPVDFNELHNDFKSQLSDLVSSLQQLYNSLMKREGPVQEVLDSREELESLSNLIERLDLNRPHTYTLNLAALRQQL